MPREDCQRAFAGAAAADGIVLVRQSVEWLTERGHLALPARARRAAVALERIYVALGGDADVLATARSRRLRGDFVHEPSGTLIEVDEHQHFTSFRRHALDLYPEDALLGFDLARYRELCDAWQGKADRYRRSKEARGFGVGGRQRQRAYYDALRDLATPAMGHPPLVRVAAPDGDGHGAYTRRRERLLTLLK